MRGVSTVLDAALCLVLVAASALTLASAPHANETEQTVATESADEIAELLATSTARVSYSVDDRNRTTHDTLAGLLASAVRVDARTDAPNAPTGGPEASSSAFAQVVTDRVDRALGRADAGVQVMARRQPTRGVPADRRIVAGGTPPPDVDVHAAEFVVRQVRFTVRTWST